MRTNRLSRRESLGLMAAAPAALAALAAHANANNAAAADEPSSESAGSILMPIGDATEVVDTLYPFFRVVEDGYRAVIAGPEARVYHMVMHEVPPSSKIPWDITEERPGYHIKAEVAFRDVDPTKFAGLFISGGRAPEYLRYDKDLLRITRHFFEANKPVAVVCHGIEIVSAAGVIRGRNVTTVAKCALDCEQGGARYVDRPVVVDGNLVTARTWHDYGTFMKEFMKQVLAGKGKEKRGVAD
jgi:protease I